LDKHFLLHIFHYISTQTKYGIENKEVEDRKGPSHYPYWTLKI